jgi:carboxyl-terminal processing protease
VKALRSSDPRLTPFAIVAVRRWLFSPGTKNGRAVYTHMQVPIVFSNDSIKASSAGAAAAGPAPSDLDRRLAAGDADLGAKHPDAALADFEAAIEAAPDSPRGYVGRAKAYALLGRPDEALDDYALASSLDPTNQPALDAYRASLPDTPARKWESTRYQTFNTVWSTVNETYYDPKFGGVDWKAVRDKYRPLLAGTADNTQLLVLMQRMLGELHRTHFSIIPRDAAVFNPAERVRIGTVGVDVAWVEGGVVVTEVRPDSKGAVVPLKPGDLVTEVDDVKLSEIQTKLAQAGLTPSRVSLYLVQFVESRLSSAVGTKVRLKVTAPSVPSAPREVVVTCGPNDAPWSEAVGYFPSQPIRSEISRSPDGIALVRFNIFVPPVMRNIRALLRQLRPGDAMIIDLRGNSGGVTIMAPGISGWLCHEEFVLVSMHQRDGTTDLEVYPQPNGFDGPVAILIDGRSASTSEILAAGLRERHRARLFGEQSAGAALPSLFRNLPTGDLFQYAFADVTTPSGMLLEGNGVVPDEAVARTRSDLLAGRDPVMEAALSWIAGQRLAARQVAKAGEAPR